jgi:hypothetical protein
LGCHQIGTLYNGKRFMVLLTWKRMDSLVHMI